MLTYTIKIEHRNGSAGVTTTVDDTTADKVERQLGHCFNHAVQIISQGLLQESGNGEMVSAPSNEQILKLSEAMWARHKRQGSARM